MFQSILCLCVLQAAAVGPSLSEQRPAGVWAAGQTEPADAGEKHAHRGDAGPTHLGTGARTSDSLFCH